MVKRDREQPPASREARFGVRPLSWPLRALVVAVLLGAVCCVPLAFGAGGADSAGSASSSGESPSVVEQVIDVVAHQEAPSQEAGPAEASPESGESASDGAEAPEQPASTASPDAGFGSGEKQRSTLVKKIKSADGTVYRVTLAYDELAGIPDGAELSVVERVQEPDDPEWKNDPDYKDRPLGTERFESADYLDERAAVLAEGLVGDDDGAFVFLTKFLDIAVVSGGEAVVPAGPVDVTVETSAVNVAGSDALEFALFGYDEELAKDEKAKRESRVTSDGQAAKPLEAENLTFEKDEKADKAAADPKRAKLRFSTDELGMFGMAGVALPKADVWSDGGESVAVYAPRSVDVEVSRSSAEQISGLDKLKANRGVIGAYTFSIDAGRDEGAMVWVRAAKADADGEGARDASADSELLAYRVKDRRVQGKGVRLESAQSALALVSGDDLLLARADRRSADAVADRLAAAGKGASASSASPAQRDGSNASASVDAALSLTRSVTASDGAVYEVTVAYGPEAGITEGAQLDVRELSVVEQVVYGMRAQIALGDETLDYSRGFDIRIVAADGSRIEPNSAVSVSIAVAGAPSLDNASIVHFTDGGADVFAPAVSASGGGSTLEFTTDSFSVYLVANTVPMLTLSFFVWDDETKTYTPYPLYDDEGLAVYRQKVKKGERPVVPQLASSDSRVFAGWYEGIYEGEGLVLRDDPYDFGAIDGITESGSVELYAVFQEYATVVFHDQLDESTDTFPIMSSRRVQLPDGGGAATAAVKIDDVSVTYNDEDENAAMSFAGWSRTKVSRANAAADDEGNPVKVVEPGEDGCILVGGDRVDLYPTFAPVHWLTYYSSYSGSGATYFAPVQCFTTGGIASPLPCPERDGYTFQGWYTGTLSKVDGTEETVSVGTQITDAEGVLVEGADNAGVRVQDSELRMTSDATLYAKWKASYYVVIWKQKTTDDLAADGERNYECVEARPFEAEIGATVSVPAELRGLGDNGDYGGYHYADSDSPKTISNGKDPVALNVYYDLNGLYGASGAAHRLVFADSLGEGKNHSLPVTHGTVGYGTSLSGYAPAPEPNDGHFAFDGWYADASRVVRVFFSDDDDYRAYAGDKALYETMPDHDLTLYAGWKGIKYTVTIDPNYGALYHYENGVLVGSGATWFGSSYDDEPILEYKHARRDYVESSSGSWFYVKHDRDYYGGSSSKNRETYYTQDPGEATEYATFEYVRGAYRYAGWYEVNADGSETPYTFGNPVDHDTELKLHWKKNGAFHIAFDPTGGWLDSGSQDRELDDATYADEAHVVLSRGATPPSNQVFVGWRVRGSADGTVYAPGQAFTLNAEDAIRVSGEDAICLDAVYAYADSASITYDANGGTVAAGTVDFGTVVAANLEESQKASCTVDAQAGTATVTNLENNSRFALGGGSGFSRDGAELKGWCNKPVYDPGDSSCELYELGGEYGVDAQEPTTLYAVWGVNVTYHLNNAGASWGSAWESSGYVYDPNANTYAQQAYLGGVAPEPEAYPSDGSGSHLLFRYWAESSAADAAAHDFSKRVNASLDLYAHWSELGIRAHVADASAETIAEKASGSDGWELSSDGIGLGEAETPLEVARADFVKQAPDGYEFAFAALAKPDDLQSLSQDDAVSAIRYDSLSKSACAKRADGDAFEPVPAGYEVYFVYYQKKQLSLAYQSMGASGTQDVDPNGQATATEAIGASRYALADCVTSPLWSAGAFSQYAFAIGAAEEDGFALLSAVSSSDDARPVLLVRNTWRGFECSTDGSSWVACGYEPRGYVVYYAQQPTTITVGEQTVAPKAQAASQAFSYTVSIENTQAQDEPVQDVTFELKSGETRILTAYYWTSGEGAHQVEHAQKVTVRQAALDGFSTEVESSAGAAAAGGLEWAYTTTGTPAAPVVTFANTAVSQTVDVHVALVGQDGVVRRDDRRAGDHSFDLAFGEGKSLADSSLGLLADDDGEYSFGGVIYGSGASADGDLVSIAGMDVDSVSYRRPDGAADGVRELVLGDGAGNALGTLGENGIYYLYYPKPQVKYAMVADDGSLGPVQGSFDGVQVSDSITYDRKPLTMNGAEVAQGAGFDIPREGIVISQEGGESSYRMPPILDEGVYERYLSYVSIGTGRADASSVTALSTSDGKQMRLQMREGMLEYSFDGENWAGLVLDGRPTIYALYEERGYDLQFGKTVEMPAGVSSPVFSNAAFGVLISSPAIKAESYAVEGADSAHVEATPAHGSVPGSIELRVQDGTDVKIKGLPRGNYTIAESGNENYNLTARSSTAAGSSSTLLPVNDSAVSFVLDAERRVEFTNAPKALCKIEDEGQEHLFYTLRSAIDYVDTEMMDGDATVEMLVDYVVPAADTVEIPSGIEVVFTTATTGRNTYSGTGAGGRAVITRSSEAASEPLFRNEGSLTLSGVTLDGASISSSAPLVSSAGSSLVIENTTLHNAKSSGRGGAISASAGNITLKAASLTGNSAAEGGALYYAANGTVRIEGTSHLTGNAATSGDGGAIYATGGTIEIAATTPLSGPATLSGNTASDGRGGAIYAVNALIALSQASSVASNSAKSGGAAYLEAGTVNISASGEAHPTVTGNRATSGDGGAFYLGSGTMNIAGGVMSGNSATSGNGGAVFTQKGIVYQTGGTIGGQDGANEAKNGSGIFIDSGSGNFSGGSVEGNAATAGGALGVGAKQVQLVFSGDIRITGNRVGDGQGNVCLDQDTSAVILARGLGGDAQIGVYVPGDFDSDLFVNRGAPGAKFATYTDNSNLAKFSNDRLGSLKPVELSASKEVMWGSSIKVEVRYLSKYNQFPPQAKGQSKFTSNAYYPTASSQAVSQLAEDIYNNSSLDLSKTAAYGGAFASDATSFDDYVTHISWSSEGEKWVLAKRDGTTADLGGNTLVIYYAEPAFVSIENNTDMPLRIDAFSVNGTSVMNSSDVAGYGWVFAKNGSIRSALLPVEESDLQLRVGDSLNLLIPGGRNLNYALTGKFDTENGKEVQLRRTLTDGMSEETIGADDSKNGFQLSGMTLDSQNTYQMIFGGDKPICKITDTDERTFTSISGAINYAKSIGKTETVIEMLTDYLLPPTDAVSVPVGYNITLTTATSGTYKYNDDEQDEGSLRATISRDSANDQSMITANGDDESTSLTLKNLIFDGKSVKGNSDGGAVSTSGCDVTVEKVDFLNVYAGNGGALYVVVDMGKANSRLTVRDSNFVKCNSTKASGDRLGGGAVHAWVNHLELDGCRFYSCSAADQAGAVFHRIDGDYDSSTTITGCVFEDCVAKAAGGVELDSKTIHVRESTFRNCVATNRNGGGLNTYCLKLAEPSATSGCSMEVTDCTFDDCHADSGDQDNYGGGLRINAVAASVSGCTFTNCSALFGGGLGISNKNATKADVLGCTFTDCRATRSKNKGGNGGGVFFAATESTIGSNPAAPEGEGRTSIIDCAASQNGGGVYQNKDSEGTSLKVEGATIEGCSATNAAGGGVYTSARTVSLIGAAIRDNRAKGNGGGVDDESNGADRTLLVEGSKISGNMSEGSGGGVYTKSNFTLRKDSEISGNRLAGSDVSYAAGAWLENGRTFEVGTQGATSADSSSIKDNFTAANTASDLRLPTKSESGITVNANCVTVLSDLNGSILVVNAMRQGTQFGTSPNSTSSSRPSGLSDGDAVFQSDDASLKGIINRLDESGKEIIWAGLPICKITDKEGNLLYFKFGRGSTLLPAVFDQLDSRITVAGNVGAFTILRTAKDKWTLCRSDGTSYGTGSDETLYVKMLVESYTVNAYFTTSAANASWENIVLMTESKTTATESDPYPYRGRRGTRCTLTRGASLDKKDNTGTVKVPFTVTDIILDGGSRDDIGVTNSFGGGLLIVKEDENAKLTIGGNAVLQNCKTTNNGAVFVNTGTLVMNGGMIRYCESKNGGAVYCASGSTLFDFQSGNILQCSAQESGGGVYLKDAKFSMSGGTISRCSAANGGGIFVDNSNTQKTFSMSGGSVTGNTATKKAGGIGMSGTNKVPLRFSEKPAVSGNKLNDEACNVQLDQNSNNLIYSSGVGLYNGAYIGVYVPDGTNLFGAHGDENLPFATYESTASTKTFYSFVNDRNGLKGGLIPGRDDKLIYWIKIFSLEVSKQIQTSANTDTLPEGEEFSFTVRVEGDAEVAGQSGARDIVGEFGGMTFVRDGDDNAAEAEFTLREGETITAENLSSGLKYTVTENLTESQMRRCTALPSRVQTGMVGENNNKQGVNPLDRYISRVSFTNLFPVCKILTNDGSLLYRQYGDASNKVEAVFADLSEAFEALDQTLYTSDASNAANYSLHDNVCQIQMLVPDYRLTGGITLGSGKNVVFTTASSSASAFPYQGSGGAVVQRDFSGSSMLTVSGGATLTASNITLDGAKASSSYAGGPGGIVSVAANGSLSLAQGAVLQNSLADGDGGAVYVAARGKVDMGSATVKSNACNGNGAGVYVAENAELRLSGSPSFGGAGVSIGAIMTTVGNFKSGSLVDKLNGGKDYTLARQDIYLAETQASPASLVLASDFSSPDGSIWVWPQSEGHYRQLKPFARLADNNASANVGALRNAHDDFESDNQTDTYLYGTRDGDTEGYVYWSGVRGKRSVVLRKVGDGLESLGGAAFTVRKGPYLTSPVASDANGNSLERVGTGASGELTSELPSGVFFAGELNYGTYYFFEDVTPVQPAGYGGGSSSRTYFEVIVGDDGVSVSGPRTY